MHSWPMNIFVCLTLIMEHELESVGECVCICVFSSKWIHPPHNPCFSWLRKAGVLPSKTIQGGNQTLAGSVTPGTDLGATRKRVTGRWQDFSPLERSDCPFLCTGPKVRAPADIGKSGKLNSVPWEQANLGRKEWGSFGWAFISFPRKETLELKEGSRTE